MSLVAAAPPSGGPIIAEVDMGADSSAPVVRATVVQASTVFYDTPATLEKAERLLAEAAGYGSQLVVFPEAFVGGYPRGSNFGAAIGNRTPKGREEFRKYHAAAIDVPGPEVDRLAAMAGKYKVFLVMGVIERDGYTLYCSVLFFDAQAICWENRMPLLRTAMYGKGIEIYCAPTADSRPTWPASMTHIALEGGCFVLSANQFCRRRDYPPAPEYVFAEIEEELGPDSIVCAGGSLIISPMGTVLAGPNYEGEALISADLDLGEIARAKFDFDVVGHYARPEVLSLTVTDNPVSAVSYTASSAAVKIDSSQTKKKSVPRSSAV
ncbi:unnamed protein product [Linum tenue]|uniref:cyanoalanine nitrilase n=1 Tax=Linum tenue TaxID=586396 RepID=A0AAV0ILF2_9ROSI|nr:unnamed protein product [Linum tenue]